MDGSFTIFFITTFLVVWLLVAVIFAAIKLVDNRSNTARIKVKCGDWNGLVPISRTAPPKPLHNPNK